MSSPHESTSELLLFRLKEGDEKAFTRIYDLFWDKLYYVAYKRIQKQEVVEGIVQEVFLTLWEKRSELSINDLSHYLAAMVRHAVYRYLAKEKESKKREHVFYSNQAQILTIDGELENKLILEKILELSNQLPEKCRLVFQYNKLEDKSLSDVAKHLNISQKTAEAHLTKALKAVRLTLRSLMSLFV